MTIDELLEALKAIVEAAEADGRDMTDEEMNRYEELETQLATARRQQEIRARQTAYETPVRDDLHVNVGTQQQDEELDRAFTHYLRTGIANQDMTELRAQSVGTDSAGGYMVSPQFRNKLVEVQKAFGGLAAEVDTFTTETGATIEYPSLDDTANQGSITAESAQFASGADLTFGTVTLGAFKYTSQGGGSQLPLRVSVELVQDAEFDIQGLISRALGTRIARKQASDWVVGTGTSLPFGIAHAGVAPSNVLDVNGTIDYDDILDTEEALDPAYEQNAKWVMNRNTWGAIRRIVDGSQRPLIQPEAQSGIGDRPQRTLIGYPVVIDQAFPNHTGSNAHFAVLGDLRESYVIRRVAPLTIVVNPYSRANFGEIEYVAWERADGNIQNRAAYSLLSNSLS